MPSHARVTVWDCRAEGGFEAPALAPWLEEATHAASKALWGNDFEYCFEGATIGTMKDFSSAFPNASFLNLGVLGAEENAHAPNESLPLDYVRKLTEALADIVAAVPQKD